MSLLTKFLSIFAPKTTQQSAGLSKLGVGEALVGDGNEVAHIIS